MIFNLFKSKPTLKELIPEKSVDIHSHILPGIDDGAKNLKESNLILNEMTKLGFSKIIGTPHTYPGLYDNTNNSIKQSFEKLNNNLENKNLISYASEYLADNSLIEKAENKSILCLKDRYVLIESSFMGFSDNIYDIIFKIQMNNYIPVLAHPERYYFLHKNYSEYIKLKKAGCIFQINLLSTCGFYGSEVTQISEKLLKDKLINYVGTDIHNINHIKAFDMNVKIKSVNNLENCINNNLEFNF